MAHSAGVIRPFGDDDVEDSEELETKDGHIGEASMGASDDDDLGVALLALVGDMTKVIVLLREAPPAEWQKLSKRVTLLYALLTQFPKIPVGDKSKKNVVGFKIEKVVAKKKAGSRRNRPGGR